MKRGSRARDSGRVFPFANARVRRTERRDAYTRAMVNFKLPRRPTSSRAATIECDVDVDVDVDAPYVSRTRARAYDDATGVDVASEACALVVATHSRSSASDDASASDRAYVHEDTMDHLGPTLARLPFARRHGREGGACVRFVASEDGSVARGRVALTAAQRYNLRTSVERVIEFEVVREEIEILVDCAFEIGGDASEEARVVDGVEARRAVRAAFGDVDRVLTVGEVFMINIANELLKVRVAETNSLNALEASKTIGYHCFRGRVGVETTFYVRSANDAALRIENNHGAHRSVRSARREIIHVQTRDGETFPVHRALLRQCISLTGVVRRAGDVEDLRSDGDGDEDVVRVEIDVDTDVFDRALIFLEATELGKPTPTYDIRVTESLAVAAETLGCRALGDWCRKKLGAHASRIREYRWDEVLAHNAAGGVWLCIDGMVLDVKRWLGEHPGGDVIIPSQSLNMDASRHFEMYHSSRESFLYLKEFYIGEVAAEDRAELVPAPEPRASEDFLAQLRQYTTFRLAPRSAVRSHLGQ